MDKAAGFIEVTVSDDSAVEASAMPHKATLAASQIVMIEEDPSQQGSDRGACVVLVAAPEDSGSWVFGDAPAAQPCERRLVVRESYEVVKWLLEKAAAEPRIFSSQDWDLAWADAHKLTRNIKAPRVARLKQKPPP